MQTYSSLQTEIPVEALYFLNDENRQAFVDCVRVSHVRFGYGLIRSIELRRSKEPVIHVDFFSQGRRRITYYSIEQRLISRLWVGDVSTWKLHQKTYFQIIALAKRARLWSDLDKSINCPNEFDFSTVLPRQRLHEKDFQLLAKWSQLTPFRKFPNLASITAFIGVNEASRLVSAREAELAVKTYFETLGFSVSDESVKQLEAGTDAWKSYDLKVDGIPVDIKNARQSYSNPFSYTEQFTKSFKFDTSTGRPVVLCATLSPYRLESEDYCLEDQGPLLLGWTLDTNLLAISRWLNHHATLISVDGFSERQGFLPGWIFDYGKSFYREYLNARTVTSRRIPESLSRSDWDYLLTRTSLAPLIFSLAADSRLYTGLVDDPSGGFLEILREGLSCVGLSRACVFVSILIHFMTSIRRNEVPNFSRLRRLIFAPKKSSSPSDFSERRYLKTRPLGLYDPGQYVWHLLHALELMIRNSQHLLSSTRFFRLSGPNLLRGKLSSGEWITLMAYCGGRLENERKCGNSPLFLNGQNLCERCGFIICDACGACSTSCR